MKIRNLNLKDGDKNMLTLRNEHFGGSVFDTTDGTLIHLDVEAFSALCKYIKNQELTDEEREFVQDMSLNLDSDVRFRFKELHPNPLSDCEYDLKEDALTDGPELVDFQITSRCNASCPHCYVDSSYDGMDTCLDDVLYVLDECQDARVYQLAFGGGEPTIHPDFPTILKETYDRGIVPNFTSNCKEVRKEVVEATREYCGAVAFSVEDIGDEFARRRGFPFETLKEHARSYQENGIKVAFHITVGLNNLQKLSQIVEELASLKPYGIIFLAFKAVGRGKINNESLIDVDPSVLHSELNNVLLSYNGRTNIGFDSCFAPGLSRLSATMRYDAFEGCVAAKTSVAITSELGVLPCSFLNDDSEYYVKGEEFRACGLMEVWNNERFKAFRTLFSKQASINTGKRCTECIAENKSGCPLMRLIPCTSYPVPVFCIEK